MKMNRASLAQTGEWAKLGVTLPKYDVAAMAERTAEKPIWVHFGAGNIFRGFVAALQQRLLNDGDADRGIIAAETFDYEIIDKIYDPFDNLTMNVTLNADATTNREIIASVAEAVRGDTSNPGQIARLREIFAAPSLQMVSFTITEKGYALTNMAGELSPLAKADIEAGPEGQLKHAMGIVASLLYTRWKSGAAPLAVVSMDNCSHNGEKLRNAITTVARGWVESGKAEAAFEAYVTDESKVSFPWSMIDKITPRPDASVEASLAADGIEDMAPVITEKHTYIAAFVNAEAPQYLVIEDRFPNGRPALEKAGVYMTDRDTVNMTERMKVTTCLNPLHTALAVYGCLLGYEKISDEMKDEQLVALIKRIGYIEGLPVVTDPGILSPKAFIDEVVTQRLPNPFMPDTPQRIACDTSQKVPIRFGETIKSYMADPDRDPANLTAIPLALAGWLRYLLGVDDEGREMAVSPDPLASALQEQLAGIELGKPETVDDKLESILTNPNLFSVSLKDAGLDGKVTGLFKEMIAGPGAVRTTLRRHLD